MFCLRRVASFCGEGGKEVGYYGLGNVPGGTAVDWREYDIGRWAMTLSGASTPVLVRVVGIVARIQTVGADVIYTLKSLTPNGFVLSRKLLQRVSVKCTGKIRLLFIGLRAYRMLDSLVGLDGIHISSFNTIGNSKVGNNHLSL